MLPSAASASVIVAFALAILTRSLERSLLGRSVPCLAMSGRIDQKSFTPELVEKVQFLLDEALRTGHCKGTWAVVKQIFIAAGIGRNKRVPPERAGVSRRNRYGLGVTGMDAQKHGVEMLSIGVHEVTDAAAFDADDDDEENEYEMLLTSRSEGLIPALEMREATVVGGNHTTVFLRQCKGHAPAADPYLKTLCPSGKLDPQLIANSQVHPHVYLNLCNNGIEYFMMNKQVPQVWPFFH